MIRSLVVIPFLALGLSSHAQTSISDCDGAIVLCGDLYEEENASLNTGNVYEWTGACNASLEQSSVWYTFTVQQDGNLDFTLDPNNDNDDYDWGLFNITQGGCAGITLQDGSSPEVSCNSYGVIGVNGATGISTAQGGIANSGGPGDLNGPPFNADLPVTDGQVYALVVMNWSNSTEGYTIDFEESTASLYDDMPPTLISASSNCSNSIITVTFSEDIVMSSVINFDFVINGPGGSYGITSASAENVGATHDDVIIVQVDGQIAEPGIYTIVIADDNGFVEDACGNLAVDSIEIELFAPLTFTYESITACNGENGTLEITEITGGNEPYIVEVNGNEIENYTLTEQDAGDYNIQITDNSGCIFNDFAVVPDHQISVVIPQLQDSLTCLQPTVEIVGTVVNPEQAVLYDWSAFDGVGNITSGAITASPTVNLPGYYVLTVTDSQSGCTAFAGVDISAGEVYGVDLQYLKIPNVVTDNNDGKNDVWEPYLASNPTLDLSSVFDVYQLKIFNRWGKLVYDSDGSATWQVGEEPEGTYFYLLKYETNCGGRQVGDLEGIITVLR
ncbi:MAG: gliding motility-associated C-terminal domain-containing protein [Flavobacteriales bacterium]